MWYPVKIDALSLLHGTQKLGVAATGVQLQIKLNEKEVVIFLRGGTEAITHSSYIDINQHVRSANN